MADIVDIQSKKKRGKKKGEGKDFIAKNPITINVRAKLDELDMNPNQLQKLANIGQNIYRLLNETRCWGIDHVRRIAEVFGCSMEDLLGERKPMQVPIVGTIEGGKGPLQTQILDSSPKEGYCTMNGSNLDKCCEMYCLQVADRSMMPLPPGAVLWVQRDTSDLIGSGSFVVHWDEDGQTTVRQAQIGKDSLILRSMTQEIPDKVLPISHLKTCDKVFRIDMPA